MKIIPLALPTPFFIGDVNVFLIKEEPLTLIDVGPKTAATFAALREKLKQNGVEISDLRRVLLTHAHEDHCGLAKQIREEARDAEFFIHPWETGHLFGRLQSDAQQKLLVRAGVPAAEFEMIKKFYAEISKYTDSLAADDFSALADDQEIEFATGVWRVIHTPGHTPGSCSFVREANRTIIAGDTILKRVTPNPIIAPDPFDAEKRFASLGEYLVSLAKIRSFAPTLVYGGHGEPIYDYEEIFHRYVRAIDARQEKLIKLIGQNGMTAFETARKLFPDAIEKDAHRFLAVSETVAHLDYAVQNGKISVESNDGVDYFRL